MKTSRPKHPVDLETAIERIKELKDTIAALEAQIKITPQSLSSAASQDTIVVNGIEIAWNIQAGVCAFRGLPVALMWVDTTLAGLMSGVAAMVGPERFALALQSEGRKSVESDWMLISRFPDFREGFAALHGNAAIAGWGDWQLIDYDTEKEQCIFRAYNNWEGMYQKTLGQCWGSSLLAGKFSGICSKLFSKNCWADQTKFVAKGDDYDEFIVRPSPRFIENEIQKLVYSDRATTADVAVAFKKLQESDEALRLSEERFRAIWNESFDGMRLIDKNGTIVMANNTFCNQIGKSIDELEDHSLDVMYDPIEGKNILSATVNNFLKKTIVPHFERELTLWNKRKVWFELSNSFIKLGTGQEYLLSIFRDITERKQAEEAMQKSETHFRTLFEKATDGIMFLSFDSKITMVNESFAKMHGYTVDEMQKMNLKDLDTPDTSRRVSERISRLMSGETLVFEVEHYHKDGHTIQLEVSANLVISENEKIIQSFHRDITERNILQNQLLQSQKLESIGTLSAGIAHDFNNILNVIVGNSELLNKSSLDEKNIRRINAIASSATRGMHLVKQLLMFARKTKENYIPLFINDVVEDIAKLISETFPKTITVSLELDNNLPKITADPNHMHQVLMNLSVNARDAMPSGGTLRYCASLQSGEILRKRFPEASTDRYVVLTVKDTGMGMDEETLRKIFDPFYTTKEVGKGTGLGMSVVQGIIKSHNGFIDVRSKVNIGTEIEIYLPVLDSEETTVISEIFENTLNLSGNETILLIEDEEFTRDVIEDLLHFNGYQVIHARDGEEGVELYKNKKDQINIVVSDFGLPKFNGEEVFRRIKGINPEVRFILISGYLEPGISNRLTTLGVNTIVAKPFKPDGLLSKIRETLDNRK